MNILTIDTAKILSNLEVIRTTAGSAEVIPVLKANAYGMDLHMLADLLRAHGIRRFAVGDPLDAQKLRDWGFQEEEILVLRSTTSPTDIRTILHACATATVGSYDAAVALNGMAEAEGMACDVHIKIDTGLGRYGFTPNELERVLAVFRYLTSLNVTGMFTQYANAATSRKKTQAQHDAFMQMVDKVRQAGFQPGMLHASDSEGLFYAKAPNLDAVRIGSALTGRIRARGEYGLQPVGRLESAVAEINWLPKGATIGEGSDYVTKQAMEVAIIPVGYADGFLLQPIRCDFRLGSRLRHALRVLFGRSRYYVNVGGKRARIIGRVGATHTTVDATGLNLSPGTAAWFEVDPVFVPERIPRRYTTPPPVMPENAADYVIED